jgi:hypothetical protein
MTLGHTYMKPWFIVYLKFKFNLVSFILSGNPAMIKHINFIRHESYEYLDSMG